jgi:hypothetical protein
MDNDLFQFLSLKIPSSPKVEDGFLEIINQQHREVINSRIYAYFLDREKNEKVAEVFLNALLELIKRKAKKNIQFENHTCYTEVSTGKGRIDIVIEDLLNEKTIIIENKLFYHLHNDLSDYWNHYKYKEENKVGILLTLEEHIIPEKVEKEFINITHIEWINEIQSLGLPSQLPSKYYIYLNDFFQTIQNITISDNMNDQTLFYFQHTEKILKAKETVSEAESFIENQISILASKLQLSIFGKTMSWRNFWDQEGDKKTYYTIVFEELMKGENKIKIIIELYEEDIEQKEVLRELLQGNELYEDMVINGEETKSYIHFAQKEYELTLSDIEQFSSFVYDKITTEFEPVMKLILKTLYPKK